MSFGDITTHYSAPELQALIDAMALNGRARVTQNFDNNLVKGGKRECKCLVILGAMGGLETPTPAL
jgi:hypothetical protein